jgi:hypothetical protein
VPDSLPCPFAVVHGENSLPNHGAGTALCKLVIMAELGGNRATIPVEQANVYELVGNRRPARALGIDDALPSRRAHNRIECLCTVGSSNDPPSFFAACSGTRASMSSTREVGMATRPVSAKTKLVHLLDDAQLDVEVGYTVAGSHVQWSARLSHDGKALGVVIDGGTFFPLNEGSRFDVGSGVAAAAQRQLGLMGPQLRAKMMACSRSR